MLLVFTGNGKGKTSAAIGVAIRALGRGKKVRFYQFMKERESGEIAILEKLGIAVEKFSTGFKWGFDKGAYEICMAGLEKIKKDIEKDLPFLLVLDELNVALSLGLLDKKAVQEFLERWKEKIHIIVTGRYAPDWIIKMGDLVTEMLEVKHPFQKGMEAIEGIDF